MNRISPMGLATVVALFLSLVAAPAHAQTPNPSPGGGSLMEQVVPGNPCPGSGTAAGAGRFPLSAYSIDYDEGGFTAVSRKAVGTLTEMTFAAARWGVSVGIWLIGWAFSFGFADRLASPMAAVAGRYRAAFFVPLVGSALMISAAYGAVQIFRGRLGRGLGEFVLSLAFVVIFGTWLLSSPQGFLGGSFRLTAQLAGSVSNVAMAEPAAGCEAPQGSFDVPRLDAAVAPLTAQIQESFVQKPYELLEWGAPVPDACAPYRDAVLSAGPGGDRNALVAGMNRPGCAALYRFNRDPSTERLGVAVLVVIAAGVLVTSLSLVAGSVVLAQVVAVGLIALTPFAALAGALPGAGRAAMWHWATALLRALATIVVMSVFLTFLLLASDALLSSTRGDSLLVQMAVLNMVAMIGISLRHRLAQSGRRAASGVGRRLERARPGVWAPAMIAPGAPPSVRASGGPWMPGALQDPLAPRVASVVARTRMAADGAPL
jgi:hypothetical protein